MKVGVWDLPDKDEEVRCCEAEGADVADLSFWEEEKVEPLELRGR